jgi:hypothetical protein
MYFDATPQNMTTLLVVALAVVTLVVLLRGRYQSNLPLLYYSAAIAVASATDRPLHPYLMMAGITCAMVLRFEFMNKAFMKLFGILTTFSICATAAGLLDQVFGDGRSFL